MYPARRMLIGGETSHWERERLLCFFGTILWPPVRDLDFPPLGLIALGFTATCASALHNAKGMHYHNQTAPCVLEEARVGTSGCVASCRPTFLSRVQPRSPGQVPVENAASIATSVFSLYCAAHLWGFT